MQLSSTLHWRYIAILEGSGVMACELLAGKMIAPYFGNTLFVWSAVLGMTFTALAAGYYIGGMFSQKMTNRWTAVHVLLIGSFFTFLMPVSGKFFMAWTLDLNIFAATCLSSLLFLFPPLFFYGMFPPLLIHSLTRHPHSSGHWAGQVFALSTVGGIGTAFVLGFAMIPDWGITLTAFILGGSIALIAFCISLFYKQLIPFVFLPLFLFTYAIHTIQHPLSSTPAYTIQYQSEGVLGQIKVVDYTYSTYHRGLKPARALIVNNTQQSILNRENLDYSLWDYSYYYPALASVYPKGSDALLLGLGGGTLLKQFKRLGFAVDVVEFDPRIKEVAIEYFNVSPATPIYIDDARHYIKTSQKRYDLIMYDTFLAEAPPGHLLTKEAITEAKQLLKPGGMLMINFFGFVTGEQGRAARSVYKTLAQQSDMYLHVLATPLSPANRTLIFIASKHRHAFEEVRFQEPGLPEINNLSRFFISADQLISEDALVLTDNRPVLEQLYIPAALAWRKSYQATYIKRFMEEGIPVFH